MAFNTQKMKARIKNYDKASTTCCVALGRHLRRDILRIVEGARRRNLDDRRSVNEASFPFSFNNPRAVCRLDLRRAPRQQIVKRKRRIQQEQVQSISKIEGRY